MKAPIVNWIQIGNDLSQKYKIWRYVNNTITSSVEHGVEIPKQIETTDWDVVFYDIETYQSDISKIVLPQHEDFHTDCEVRLICAYSYYKNVLSKYVYTLESLTPYITEALGVKYYYSSNPSHQFLEHLRLRSNTRPTMLVGYNSSSGSEEVTYPGYDLPAIFTSANYSPYVTYTLSKLDNRKCKNLLVYNNVFLLDLLPLSYEYCTRNSYKDSYITNLRSNTGLEGLARVFNIEGKNYISLQALNEGLCGEGINRVIDYCLQDVNICYQAFMKMNIIEYFNGFIRSFKISPLTVLRGQQAKTLFCLDSIKSDNSRWEMTSLDLPDDAVYKGGDTLCETSGIYELISITDFNSLYPSACIEYNICYSTYLGLENELPVDLDVSRVPNVYKGLAACFSKQFKGHVPTFMSNCLDARKRLKAEYSITKDPSIKFEEQAAKVLGNGGYGSTGNEDFPYYRKCVAFSITAAGRYALSIMNSIYNDLHINVILGDTDSSFGVKDINCVLKCESDVVREVNERLSNRGFNYLRVSGELGDTPSKIITLGKKKQYIAMKNGVLKCAGYAFSTKSNSYNSSVYELMKTLLLSNNMNECADAFNIFKLKLVELYNTQELYYTTKVKKTDKFDIQPSSTYVKWIPSPSGIKITDLSNRDNSDYVIDHFFKHLVCTYLGYEDSLSSTYRYYHSGMSMIDMWNQIFIRTKNTNMREDSRAELVIRDYISMNVCFVYNNIHHSHPYSILTSKNSVDKYYEQLDTTHIEKCMSIALRCRKYNTLYLVGIDIDSKHVDRINIWPSDTLGCKTRKGYHFFYYTNSISGIQNVYGYDTSIIGSVEIKRNNLSLELMGYHRSLGFKYMLNNIPIAYIDKKILKKRLDQFHLLSLSYRDNLYINSVTSSEYMTPIILDSITSTISQCNESSYNAELLTSTSLVDLMWAESRADMPASINVGEDEDNEDDDLTTSDQEAIIPNLSAYTSEEIIDELKSYMASITIEQWRDYSGFIVGLFLPLQSLLTQEERRVIITHSEQQPNFQQCTRRNKLRPFLPQKHKDYGVCLGTLRNNSHSLPKLFNRTYANMSRKKASITNAEVSTHLRVDGFDSPYKALAIKAPCAHGKTKVMCEFIRSLDPNIVTVLLTNRNIQIDAYKSELQMDDDINVICGGSLYEENKRCYIATFESTWKLSDLSRSDKLIYVFIDEAESFLSQIRSSPNYHMYVPNHDTVLRLLANSVKIVMLDAFLSDSTITFLSLGGDVTKREFTHSYMKVKTDIIDGGKSKLMLEQSLPSEGDTKMLQLDLEIKAELESGASIGICSDEKRMTEKYFNALNATYPCKIINSDNPLILSEFNPDDYRVIIWSPSIQHTTSIIPSTNYTRTFCIIQHKYLEDFKITNMVHRIRTVQRITLFIRNLGTLFSPKSYDELQHNFYNTLIKYRPFLVNYHKSGDMLRDLRITQSVSKLHAINALQRYIPHTFERYKDLMKYTSISVDTLELNHSTTLKRSCDMWPYPHKPKKLDTPLQEQHASLNIDLQILRADTLLKDIHDWLMHNTDYDIRQIEPIKLDADQTSTMIEELGLDSIENLIKRVNRTRYTSCDTHAPNSIVFVRIINRVHTSEDLVTNTAYNTHIDPTVCGREMHVPAYAICPGEGWVKKKVTIQCQHRDTHCWVKKMPVLGCNGVEHVLCSEYPEAPDDSGWVKKKVGRRCEHRNIWCWERVIV